MRPITFSIGAVAAGRFEDALELLRGRVDAIELSVLRLEEVEPDECRSALNLDGSSSGRSAGCAPGRGTVSPPAAPRIWP
jgi:hypothetical protein